MGWFFKEKDVITLYFGGRKMNDEKKVKIVEKATIMTDYNGPPIVSSRDIVVEGGIVPYYSSSSATFSSGSIIKAYDEIKAQGEIEENFLTYIDKEEKKRRITKNKAIKKLSEAYHNKNLVFVFGAGISKSQNIPDWNELLKELLSKALQNEGIDLSLAKIFSKMYLDQFSKNLLITARYIRKHIGDDEFSLEKETQRLIYSSVDRKLLPLYIQILELCRKTGASQGLDSIITYNYDDIIEYLCDKSVPKIKYNCRYSKTTGGLGRGVIINHVHGYLGEGQDKFNIDEKIVLSEETYHEQYSEIYKWSNLVQLDKFMNKTCLFIGLSFRDPNMRRLLDIAYHENAGRQKHYFIDKKEEKLKRQEIKSALNNNQSLMNDKRETGETFDNFCKKLINQIYRFEEDDLRSFGIETIWIKDWNELPEILEKIRQQV